MLEILFDSSPHYNERPDGIVPTMVVIHYTDTSSLRETLTIFHGPDAQVSCHYLIDEDGTIYQMVADDKRAWHAGVSAWQREENLNNCSIGIELQNGGRQYQHKHGEWPPYPHAQIGALKKLLQHLQSTYHIPSDRIIGHADIAPGRKEDPGPHFPWDHVKKALS